MREIDEMLDAKDEAEEGPLEDPEMDDDDGNDTTLDASQIATLDGSDQDDVVALSDGTQVTFHSISINMHPIPKALKTWIPVCLWTSSSQILLACKQAHLFGRRDHSKRQQRTGEPGEKNSILLVSSFAHDTLPKQVSLLTG